MRLRPPCRLAALLHDCSLWFRRLLRCTRPCALIGSGIGSGSAVGMSRDRARSTLRRHGDRRLLRRIVSATRRSSAAAEDRLERATIVHEVQHGSVAWHLQVNKLLGDAIIPSMRA
jgi:hypothetical protein